MHMDGELVFLFFGAGGAVLPGAGDPVATLQTLVPGTAISTGMAETAAPFTAAPAAMDDRAKAKMQGYEGDPCGECGNYTLVRNGTCMKCNACGGTSGCS